MDKSIIVFLRGSTHFPGGETFSITMQKLFQTIWNIQYLEYAIIGIIAIIGIAILWNQRKIRKELRQLREMIEKDNPENL